VGWTAYGWKAGKHEHYSLHFGFVICVFGRLQLILWGNLCIGWSVIFIALLLWAAYSSRSLGIAERKSFISPKTFLPDSS
jgi:hypothetical protein